MSICDRDPTICFNMLCVKRGSSQAICEIVRLLNRVKDAKAGPLVLKEECQLVKAASSDSSPWETVAAKFGGSYTFTIPQPQAPQK